MVLKNIAPSMTMSVAYTHAESTKHTHTCTTQDVKAMLTIVQQAKPFQYQKIYVEHFIHFQM